MPTKRESWLSIINMVMCLGVVYAHISSAPISSLDRESVQFALVFFPWRFLHFITPGFVFLTGLRTFLGKTARFDCIKFYRSRVTKILLPYIIINFIYYIFYVRIGYFPFSIKELIAYTVSGTLVSPFYFVILILQFYALVPLWRRFCKAVNPAAALVFAALFTYLCRFAIPQTIEITTGYSFGYSDRVFTSYLFFWLAGVYAGLNFERFKSILAENRVFAIAVFVIFTALDSILSYLTFARSYYFSFSELVNFISHTGTIFALCAIVYALYENRPLKSRFMRELDGAGYYIFLLHSLAIVRIDLIIERLGIGRIGAQLVIRLVAVYTVTIGVSILLVKITARIQKRFSRAGVGAARE